MNTMLLINLVDWLFQAAYLALFIRVILSWIPHDPYQPLIQFLYQITDPILKPFQRLIPPSQFGIDFSPIVAFMALSILKRIVMSFLLMS